MTREEFIVRLCAIFEMDTKDIYSYGQHNGWLEYEDELYRNEPVTRKNIARIIHMFLLKEKGIADISDIHEAEVLRDLYDCRVCANHVAQVYLRGIMDAKELAVNGGFMWFDLDGENKNDDIEECVSRARKVVEGLGV